MRALRCILPLASVISLTMTPSCVSNSGSTQLQEKKVPSYTGIDRQDFNRLAVRLNIPVFWELDANSNQAIDPDEVRSLLFYPKQERWTEGAAFTPSFAAAFQSITALAQSPRTEDERKRLVEQELDLGLTTIIYARLSQLDVQEQAFAKHMLKISQRIDQLYAKQIGLDSLQKQLAEDDKASQSLFRRNWGPRCRSAALEKNPKCSAIAGAPPIIFDIYPETLQNKANFCQTLEQHPEARVLMDPFVVVREEKGKLSAVPYTKAYQDLLTEIAKDLQAAVPLLGAGEAALKIYLQAAAASFMSNDWTPADEAWSRMSATNSRFYLRVAPDETYWDPCARKAGFHMTFGLINKASLDWQNKLTPGLQQMEDEIAKLIGSPYKSRRVSFHLPDFIDLIANAGDDRQPFGLTVGQSLPNWGPVANEGRGRTIVMSNVFQDELSKNIARQKAESLFSQADLAIYSSQVNILNTILHEINHNLGPSHEYAYKGQRAGEMFGGQLANMLEELKAQTSGLYFIDSLEKKGLIDAAVAKQLYMDGVIWAFGQIANGMWTAQKERKAYSQLAAIQLGILLREKAVVFDAKGLAANGKDQGIFHIDFAKMHPALTKMTKEIGQIKAQGLKAQAESFTRNYVDGNEAMRDLIASRILRYPKQSFVYAVDL